MSKLFKSLLILSFSLLGVCNLPIAQAETQQSQIQKPFLAQANSAEADQLLQEGIQVYQQGTIEAKQQALTKFEQSLKLYQALDNKRGQANALNNIGLVYSELGERQKALDYYNQALPFFKALDNKEGQANALLNIGEVYGESGEKQKALDFFNQALSFFKALNNKEGQANVLNNIGLVYSELGERQKALNYLNQALTLFKALDNKEEQVRALVNIGNVYGDLGEKQKALDFFNQALPLSTAVKNPTGEAGILNNIGEVYQELGELPKALDYYNQALPIWRSLSDRAAEATTLNNIGLVYDDLGEKQKALDFFNQALPLSRAVKDPIGEARLLGNTGKVYYELGERQKALDFFNQALLICRSLSDRGAEAIELNNIGLAYGDLGEHQKALDFYNQALPLSRAVKEPNKEVLILYNIAVLQRSQNNLDEALTDINSAIAIIEDLRVKIIDPDLRTSYFATVQDYYQLKIDLLMQLHKQQPNQGYNIQALETSESARARGLLDLLKEAHANIKQGVDPKLLEQERSIQQRLDAFEKRRIELSSKGQPIPESLDQEYNTLIKQYDDNKDQIRLTSPRYAKLKYSKPLKLTEIQQLLDDDTIILEYSLGKDHSYLWLVTKNSLTSYELPKKAEIQTLVNEYRKILTGQRNNISAQIEIDKLAPKLQAILANGASQLSNKRLVIVADGALEFIPFGALPFSDSKQPLLVTNEVINLPSASTLALLREERQRAPKTVAVLADPVFSLDDPRLKQVHPTNTTQPDLSTEVSQRSAREYLPRLFHTKDEAEAIRKLVSPEQEKIALDFEANLANATNPELVNYRFIHFATHGHIDINKPELSYLVFSKFNAKGESENGYLRLGDIFNLKLGADLVVLSACETGLGKELQGEGLVGLTRGFIYAGAPRVIVSLWSVDDQATSILMGKFYEGILKQGLTPSQSLRQAQQELRKDPKYEAPYYWAPFVLQGEWK